MQSPRGAQALNVVSNLSPPWQSMTYPAVFITALLVFCSVTLVGPTHFIVVVIPIIASILVVAILLSTYSFWNLRMLHQRMIDAFKNTDREYFSVFESVLDGVLIVDDSGHCLDANPAAGEILRCHSDHLIGAKIARFFCDQSAFAEGWTEFLRAKKQRG